MSNGIRMCGRSQTLRQGLWRVLCHSPEAGGAAADGMILDDMFQPLSIIRQGYRSVVDPNAYVYDITAQMVFRNEFHRR